MGEWSLWGGKLKAEAEAEGLRVLRDVYRSWATIDTSSIVDRGPVQLQRVPFD